jgi:hypothetical protein
MAQPVKVVYLSPADFVWLRMLYLASPWAMSFESMADIIRRECHLEYRVKES